MADGEVRKILVSEVLNRSRLEKLLRDSYGNYVIQTILDYCDVNQRMLVSFLESLGTQVLMNAQLVECIRPLLPSIRNTPYGKRIQSKLAREDASFFNPPHQGFGVRGGFRGGPGGPGGSGGPGGGNYHRHLGRPQLQHINALTEVYGSQGGPAQFMGQGGYMHPAQPPYAPGPVPPRDGHLAQAHSGMSFHAPGPDGQPWLHLRGPTGGPAGNWSAETPDGLLPGQLQGQYDSRSTGAMSAQATGSVPGDGMGTGMPIWSDPNHQHNPHGFLPYPGQGLAML